MLGAEQRTARAYVRYFDGMATSNAFSRKVWWRLSNFLVTRNLYVVSLEPGTCQPQSRNAQWRATGSRIATCQ